MLQLLYRLVQFLEFTTTQTSLPVRVSRAKAPIDTGMIYNLALLPLVLRAMHPGEHLLQYKVYIRGENGVEVSAHTEKANNQS